MSEKIFEWDDKLQTNKQTIFILYVKLCNIDNVQL